MIRDTMPSSVRPGHVPTLDAPIRIRRDRQTLEIDELELHVDPRGRFGPDVAAQTPQVRWTLDGSLMTDEIVLIFGRSLDWTGPISQRARQLTLVEDVFPQPFALSRSRPWMLSGPPRVPFPQGVDTVGWSFGAVLVRGDDTPWIGRSVLRLIRT